MELIIQALGHLEKHELKIVRLVCKTWSHYASEPLFDKLYISPRVEDIRVFKLITQHPQLRRCIRKLEYDATRFSPDLSIMDYVRNLIDCAPLETKDFNDMRRIRERENLDPQIDEYLSWLISWRNNAPDSWSCKKFELYDFVIEGHRSWEECAAYQQRCIKSGDYLRILVYGLRNLDRVESVHECQKWDIRPSQFHEAHYYNSPFGRTWSIFRAQPRCWREDGSLADRFDDFWLLTTALALSQRRIRDFNTAELPSTVFDTLKHTTESMVECSVDAYSGLENLSLTLWHKVSQVGPDSKLDKLSGLQTLLGSMTGLKTLNLHFPGKSRPHFRKSEEHCSLERVLPAEVHWTGLTSFRLGAVSTSAKDLVQLLTIRMPNLQEIHFLWVYLVEDKWEGVIECMKRSMHLRHLSLGQGRGPWELWLCATGFVHARDIEKYVLRGGRHPCLLSDEPDSASEKYLSAPWL